jgi:cell division protein FtsZ
LRDRLPPGRLWRTGRPTCSSASPAPSRLQACDSDRRRWLPSRRHASGAGDVVAVAPKAAARPAPAQASINLDVTERTKPARDDDDLQIPAFLRRQAN